MSSSPEPVYSPDIQPFSEIPTLADKEREETFEPDQFHNFLYRLQKQYGAIFRLDFSGKPVVVLSDPSAVRYLLKNRPVPVRRARNMADIFSEMGINGVFTAEGDEWQRYRRMLNAGLNTSSIKSFYAIIRKSAERLHQTLSVEKKPFDFQRIIERYTTDITTELAFGYDLNSLTSPKSLLQDNLSFIFPMISQRMRSPKPYWRTQKREQDLKLEQALAEVRGFAQKFINNARKRVSDTQQAQNILEAMILNNEADDEALYGNIITLLLAGEDTTANTIAWTIDSLICRSSDLIFRTKYLRKLRNTTLSKVLLAGMIWTGFH